MKVVVTWSLPKYRPTMPQNSFDNQALPGCSGELTVLPRHYSWILYIYLFVDICICNDVVIGEKSVDYCS